MKTLIYTVPPLMAGPRPLSTPSNQDSHCTAMPILSSSLLVQFVALAVFTASIPLAVVTTAPTNSDVFAVLGAGPASFITTFLALAQGKKYTEIVSIFISSAAVGAFGPGIAVWLLSVLLPSTWTQWVPGMTWHVWAGSGFLMSLVGWIFVRAFMTNSADSLPRLIGAAFDRLPQRRKPRSTRSSTRGKNSHLIALLFICWSLMCCTSTKRTTTTPLPTGGKTVEEVNTVSAPGLTDLLLSLGGNWLRDQFSSDPDKP